ncbi:unnamed protein product [Anisakis simplex]|uniref:Indoleamine 2,3-dioxygenase 1 (inferred by orthology to a zebrafish protein) n=1 Tax=Anisakis simplex TaxID=6269 RepID=A0A0M3K7S0_ANISI|nr:unnamed protein product [Anisakis simplex]
MTGECVEDILSEFHVDPKLGFVLPDPLTRLPDVFKPWQEIVDALPELLESQTIEQRIDALPIIDTTQLKSNKELRLAHLLLVTLSSAYVWNRGSDKPHLSIPRQISQPLIDVSDRTGLKPIVVHASACLANWKRCNTESKCGIADERSELFRAEDVSLIAFRFTRHPGNEWFFTLTAQVISLSARFSLQFCDDIKTF